MPYHVSLRDSRGRVVYDSSLRNFSLISRKSFNLPSGERGLTIPIPGEYTCPFVRVNENYFSNFYCNFSINNNEIGIFQTNNNNRPVQIIVYFMGIGTSGIQPEYGAVVRDESGKIVWSSLDNPLFVRTAPIRSNHANVGVSVVSGAPAAVPANVLGMATRRNGTVFVTAMGFSNGIFTTHYGRTGGSGDWRFTGDTTDYQSYIETNYMD